MQCPNCNSKLSFFSIKKAEFRCPVCNIELLIENNSSVLNITFLVCGLIIIPASIGIVGGSFWGIVLGGGVSALVYFFITPLFLRIARTEVQKNEASDNP